MTNAFNEDDDDDVLHNDCTSMVQFHEVRVVSFFSIFQFQCCLLCVCVCFGVHVML